MITIMLVDDHVAVREGLRALIETQAEFSIIAEAASSGEAQARLTSGVPDLVVTDLQMAAGGGIDLITAVRRHHPDLPIAVLTAFGGPADIDAALTAGATSYLLKDTPRADLFSALRRTSQGETVLSPAVTAQVVRRLHPPEEPATPRLTARELEILDHVAHGRINADIARRLRISEATVKTYLARIYTKFEVNDRAAAVATGYQLGLLPVNEPD